MNYTYVVANFYNLDTFNIEGSQPSRQNFMYGIKKNMSIRAFLEKAFMESFKCILDKPNVIFKKTLIKDLNLGVNNSAVDTTKKVKDYIPENGRDNIGYINITFKLKLTIIKCNMLNKNIIYLLLPLNSMVVEVIKLLKPFTKSTSFYDKNNKVITSSNKIQDIAQISDNMYELNYKDTTPISDDKSEDGYIYMIKTREFIKSKEEIYKIGKTERNILNRISEYPKNSKIICCLTVDKQKLTETELNLIRLFTTKFKQRVDIGTEYFEGNKSLMIKEIFSEIIN